MHKTRVRSGLFHQGGAETVVSMGDVSFANATGQAATGKTGFLPGLVITILLRLCQ